MALNVKLLKESFEAVKPIANEAISYFYETMFSRYPEAKALFAKVNMDRQKKALIGSLVYVVDHLESPDELSEYLKKMGVRHVKYNVQPEHYPIVGECLLATFAHFFGDQWTAELNEAWGEAYGAITQLMLSGVEEQSDVMGIARTKVRKIVFQAVDEVLADPAFKREVSARVKKLLAAALEAEVESALSKKAA